MCSWRYKEISVSFYHLPCVSNFYPSQTEMSHHFHILTYFGSNFLILSFFVENFSPKWLVIRHQQNNYWFRKESNNYITTLLPNIFRCAKCISRREGTRLDERLTFELPYQQPQHYDGWPRYDSSIMSSSCHHSSSMWFSIPWFFKLYGQTWHDSFYHQLLP